MAMMFKKSFFSVLGLLPKVSEVLPLQSTIPGSGLVLNSNYVRTFFSGSSKGQAFHLHVPFKKPSYHIFGATIRKCQPESSAMRFNSTASSQLPTKSGRLEAIQKHISPLATRRPIRKKLGKDQAVDKDVFNVTAYAAAEEIHLESLKNDLAIQGLYELSSLPKDINDSIYVRAKYKVEKEPREFFIFREGAVVFWNLPLVERQEVLKFLRNHQEDTYSPDLVREEKEEMDYLYTDSATKLSGDEIQLGHPTSSKTDENVTPIDEKLALEKYAFSNALSLSVKLSIWEASLTQYVDSIEWVTEDLRNGNQIKMSRADVMKKTGELFTLRHLINLSSDLLDTPDFYWDRPELEDHYLKACNYLNISRRTRVMNEKLNYCCELAELLTTHLNDQHHTRLEWMIIILILVEVVFEVVHLLERYV
ncbi:required for meiotic nuclear division protein 1 homolog [Lineus longissimus]|uniref:required for meiotic nuclear division protein 1 homolog n=1 Tax=Lineus longissimus TaxID=88925 RepID=UPI002B4C2C25